MGSFRKILMCQVFISFFGTLGILCVKEREKGSDDGNEVPGPSPLFLHLVIASAFLNPIFYMSGRRKEFQ